MRPMPSLTTSFESELRCSSGSRARNSIPSNAPPKMLAKTMPLSIRDGMKPSSGYRSKELGPCHRLDDAAFPTEIHLGQKQEEASLIFRLASAFFEGRFWEFL